MTLKPLGNNVIISAAPKETATASGIILPDSGDKERPERGTVVAVGSGKLLDNGSRQAIDIKVGDLVIFKKYSPDEVELKDGSETKKYLVLSADDIMAVIE